jgi:hypothetical protein
MQVSAQRPAPRQQCVSMPEGYNVNSEDPEVQAMLQRAFAVAEDYAAASFTQDQRALVTDPTPPEAGAGTFIAGQSD